MSMPKEWTDKIKA